MCTCRERLEKERTPRSKFSIESKPQKESGWINSLTEEEGEVDVKAVVEEELHLNEVAKGAEKQHHKQVHHLTADEPRDPAMENKSKLIDAIFFILEKKVNILPRQ